VSHPDRLGKYQITDVLGEGAMGVVYKGFDPDIRRVVALKTIRRQLDDRTDGGGISAAARFRNEAQAAGRLMHQGIVQVYDFGVDADVAFIAMEFVEGHTLAHYLSNKVRFTDEDIPGVMCQVLDALDHAHEQGVWHRDIKPANIIMARNGKLKVADFGIARIEDAGLTQANVMIGTPTYMAPEQFLGSKMDRRVDVYSSGVLLYLLLTGRPPFTGTQEQLLYKVVHEVPVAPSQVDGVQRPRYYDAIVAKALAKDPGQRYATAAAFREAIERGVGQPFDTTVWEHTVTSAPARARPAASGSGSGSGTPANRSTTSGPVTGSSGGWTSLPTHWDKSALAQAEASLAKHVGPLAGVLVRRAARECTDLPSLYAKLAEQVTNPQARSAFLGHATSVTQIKTGIQPTSVSGTRAATQPTSIGGSAPLDAALLETAQKLLAQHVGPIAKVVVKKAADRSTDRGTFFNHLADAVPDGAARQKLLTELSRLA